jgi:predicted AAA+ superfamily ATPase
LHFKCKIANVSSGYIDRAIEPIIQKAAREFPAIVLTGPRQSGKTTLLKHLFGNVARDVSLERPDLRAAAMADPNGFLDLYPPPVIFDEAQFAAGLLPYVKERLDDRRALRGQYLLTGSQNLNLASEVTESLAGRAAMLRLLPLSQREIAGDHGRALPWEPSSFVPRARASEADQWTKFLRGGYPELAAEPDRDITLWHSSYVQTYLERDVRSLRQVGDLASFQSFLRALAARSGQLLNLSELSRDLGIVMNTAKSWLSVLEATFQVVVLRPYHVNIGKRLVKSPKVYFTDTGTLCYLTGLKDAAHARSGPMGGVIFETAVLMEILKTIISRGEEPRIYFWRTATGVEVDLLVDTGDRLIPIEVKLSSTPLPAMAEGIRALRQDLGERVGPGYVVHSGDGRLPLGSSVTAVPFREL